MPAMDPRRDERLARRAAQRRRLARRRRAALGLLVTMAAAVALAAAMRGGGDRTSPGAAVAGGAVTFPEEPRLQEVARQDRRRLRVAAVGDTVMGSPPYGLPPDGGRSFFDPVDQHLRGDVVMGNLEGVLATGGTSKCGSGRPNCFAFRTPPSYARWMRIAGFNVMNLANNHSYDFGETGLRQTVAALRRAGIQDTGRPGTLARRKVRGLRVAVLGFAPYRWAESLLDIPAAQRRVADVARTADIVIVTFHGGAEGRDRARVPRGPETHLGEPRGDLRRFARSVVDAGADLVVGHGPHVLRGMEVYRERLIAYSLGNFAGYGVFALDGALSTSAVLQVTLLSDGRLLGGRVVPTQLVGKGTPAPGGRAISDLRRLSRLDFGPSAPRITGAGAIRPPARSAAPA